MVGTILLLQQRHWLLEQWLPRIAQADHGQAGRGPQITGTSTGAPRKPDGTWSICVSRAINKVSVSTVSSSFARSTYDAPWARISGRTMTHRSSVRLKASREWACFIWVEWEWGLTLRAQRGHAFLRNQDFLRVQRESNSVVRNTNNQGALSYTCYISVLGNQLHTLKMLT